VWKAVRACRATAAGMLPRPLNPQEWICHTEQQLVDVDGVLIDG
jgi:hypothetical protein